MILNCSRLSSSNLTPKTAEEKAKIAEEVKAKQLAEIEDKKKKREQVRLSKRVQLILDPEVARASTRNLGN